MYTAQLNFPDGKTRTIPLAVLHRDGAMEARLAREQVPAGVESIDFLPDYLTAKDGDDGYLVVPHGRNWTGSFLSRFKPRADTEFISRGCVLPFFGCKRADGCTLAVVNGMPHDFSTVASVKGGCYRIYARYELEQDSPYEDLCITYYQLADDQADYSGMARFYRNLQLESGRCRTLRDRLNDVLDYATQSVEIRIRQGWKPVPPPVLEQTPETEPPMHVAMTFRQVEDLLDELHRQGVDKAEICLVGWNQKGHDGRWPQIFPVEEALGGEAGLRRLIAKAQQMGYQIVCHTNHSDAYRIADCWDEQNLIKNKDGSLSKNTVWSGGQMYNVCPICSLRLARSELPKVAALGFSGLHYIDVLSIVAPRKCYDPNHPQHRGQTVENLRAIMAGCQELFGGFASEGAYDFAAGKLDFALYVTFNILGKQPDIADAVIPLWQLVYHGIILSNPSSETVNYPIKDWQTQLKFQEHGGRPLFYFYSKFVGGDRANWMGDLDLTANTPEELRVGVGHIKAAYETYRQLQSLQLSFMDKHEWLTDQVCQTWYADGSSYVFNYSDADVMASGVSIPAHAWRQVSAPPGKNR